MKNTIGGACKPLVLGICVGGLACPALAVSDLSLAGGVGLEGHDNAGLVNTGEKSDVKRVVNADIGYKNTDAAVNVDLGYRAEYGDYVNDAQSDQTTVNGKAELKWLIAPGRLDAILNHQISQRLIDRRGLDVASNREARSIVTAGVDGFLHLSGVDSIALRPRFVNVNFQESSGSNSDRASMVAAWSHKVSPVTAFDLTVNYDRARFDDSQNDYASPGAMLSFRTSLSKLSYQVGLGANRVNRDTGKDISGSMVRAAINYSGNEGQEWGASYVRQLTDTSVGLSGFELSLDNFQSNDSNANQFDIVQEDKIDAFWRGRVSSTSFVTLGIGYQKQDYKDTPRDQNIASSQASYQYSINSHWSVGVNARFDRTKFLDAPKFEYDTRRIYLNATYHPLRPLEIRFAVGQDKRDADTSVQSYTDKVVSVGLTYQFL